MKISKDESVPQINQNEEAKLIYNLTNNGNQLLEVLDHLQSLEKSKNALLNRLRDLQNERITLQNTIIKK